MKLLKSIISICGVLSIFASFVVGCQINSSTDAVQPSSTVNISETAKISSSTPILPPIITENQHNFPSPSPSISTQSPNISIQKSLLSYISEGWLNLHMPSPYFGPFIFYIDYERIRDAEHLGAINSSYSPEEKRAYQSMIDKSTQGIEMFPASHSPIQEPMFYEKWGWDITDISQALYLPDFEILLMRGTFDIHLMQNKLAERGMHKIQEEGFVIYEQPALFYAFVSDVVVVGTNKISDPTMFITSMKMFHDQGTSSLADHPFIQDAYNADNQPWGLVLMPSPDISLLNTPPPAPPDLIEKWNDLFGGFTPIQQPGWDIMTASFEGDGNRTLLRFSYNYENPQTASKNLEDIRKILTESPSFFILGRKWSDFMTLERIVTVDDSIVAEAVTSMPGLLGQAIMSNDTGPFQAIK